MIVCVCNDVRSKDIEFVIDQCDTVSDVSACTGAGTACQKCHYTIERMLEEYKKTLPGELSW